MKIVEKGKESTNYKLGDEGSSPNSSTYGNMVLAGDNICLHFHFIDVKITKCQLIRAI